MMLSKTFVVGVDLAIGIALVMCLSVSQPAQAHQQRINATSLASKSLSAGVLGQVKARPFLHRMATLTASRNNTASATATIAYVEGQIAKAGGGTKATAGTQEGSATGISCHGKEWGDDCGVDKATGRKCYCVDIPVPPQLETHPKFANMPLQCRVLDGPVCS